jgi:membrane-bound lytic murein transglycosylase A
MKWTALLIFLAMIFSGCIHPRIPRTVTDNTSAAALSRDTGSLRSMERAVRNSLDALSKLDNREKVNLGYITLTTGDLVETLATFLEILHQSSDLEDLRAMIREHFELYEIPEPVTFTAYYEPVLRGSLVKTARFRYPLYRTPEEIRSHGSQSSPSPGGDETVIYHSRETIDSRGALEGRNLELVYLEDPVERFFLHVQGAGSVHLTDQRVLRVQYDGSNGRPYTSIGKALIDEGKLLPEEGSLPGIKRYLLGHPDEMDRVMHINERYIFFKITQTGTQGVQDVELTPYRSLATDPEVIPIGSLLFYRTEFPLFDSEGKLTGWQERSAFGVSQDVGDAIRGPFRADIFTGEGRIAAATAGHLKTKGKLYVLLRKPSFPAQ